MYTIWSSIQQTFFLISLTGKYMHEMSILVAKKVTCTSCMLSKKATCTSKNLHALVHVFTQVNGALAHSPPLAAIAGLIGMLVKGQHLETG